MVVAVPTRRGGTIPCSELFIDVDGTLIDDAGTMCEGAREKLKQLADRYNLTLWSRTGEEWARKVATRNGIEKYFKRIIPKPDCMIDNEGIDWVGHGVAIIRLDGPNGDWNKTISELFSGSRAYDEDGPKQEGKPSAKG